MIWNIIDERKRHYRWKLVHAAIEPTWHDNRCADADQAERWNGESEYDERKNVSVAEAVAWASQFPFPVTLYLRTPEN